MSTLNNKTIYLKTPYIQNQLVYNVPLQVYSEDGTTIVNDIKIQALKIDSLNLEIKVGNELIQNINFTASINNTANGIIVTLFQNILEAEFLEIFRYTNPQSSTEYQNQIQTITLKQSLNTDITNAFNSLQEHEKLIQNTRTQTSKYSDIISTHNIEINTLKNDILTHTHNARKLIFNPVSNNNATNVQDAIENNAIAIMEVARGNVDREGARVASIVNIDLQNITAIDGITLTFEDRVLIKDQTNKAENGIYVFDGVSGLTRALDVNTIPLIQGSRVQAEEGTSAEKQFKLIANDLQGVIDNEPVFIEEQFYAITNNQIKLNNFYKQPAQTFIANVSNTLSEPQYVTTSEVKNTLLINNIDNTSDLNKPISTAIQTALDLKANESDLEDLNSYTVAQLLNLQTEIGTKQDNLPIGGNDQYLGFDSNTIVVKTLNINLIEGGENLDNTRDVDKPISNPQAILFNKCFQEKGSLENFTINGSFLNCIALSSGNYYIPNTLLMAIADKPSQIQSNSVANLILHNVYLGEEKIAQTQTLIEIATTETFIYTRVIIILPTENIKNWTKLANNLDVATLEAQIQNIIVGQLQDIYVPQTQFITALNLKQDALPNGTSEEYVRGDKTIGILSTNAVVEGTNQSRLYHSGARVRATTLTGYAETNTITTATDTILQALGKKADRITTYTKTEVDTLLLNPTLLGTFSFKKFPSDVTPPAIKTHSNGMKEFLFNNQIVTQMQAPTYFALIQSYGSTATSIQLSECGEVIGIAGDGAGLTARANGSNTGEEKHVLTLDELAEHDHLYYEPSGTLGPSQDGPSLKLASLFNDLKHTSQTGGSQPFNVMQPTYFASTYFVAW